MRIRRAGSGRVVDPLGAALGAGEVEAEVMRLGPQVVDHRWAQPAAEPAVRRVLGGRVRELAQGGRHLSSDGGVVAVGGLAVAVLLDGEPAVADSDRPGDRCRSRQTRRGEVALARERSFVSRSRDT